METYLIWLVTYACFTFSLLAATSVFIYYRSRRFKQIEGVTVPDISLPVSPRNNGSTWIAVPSVSRFSSALYGGIKPEPAFRARLSFIQPDRQEGDPEKIFSQTGMCVSYIGSSIKWMWRGLVAFSNLSLLLFCMDEYHWIKFNPGSRKTGETVINDGHYDWTQAGEPVLLIYISVHLVMLCLAIFNADMTFMVPAPLSACSHVLIAEEDPDVCDEGFSAPSLVDRVEDNWLRTCKRWVQGKKESFRRRLKWKLEEVCVVDTENGFGSRGCLLRAIYYKCFFLSRLVRWFYHTSMWYKWSRSRGFFHMSRFNIPAPYHMHEQYKCGGLDEDQADFARLTYGRNVIDIKVDSILRSLINEFKSSIYIYQFAIFWLFFWYGTWNVAIFFIFMTLSSGSFRALYVVRRNQVKIQELAFQQSDVTVLRRPGKIRNRKVITGEQYERHKPREEQGATSSHLAPPALQDNEGSDNSEVIKNGRWVQNDSSLIYPGDIFVVQEGICPVDCVLLYGGVVVNESALTGEPLPISKSPVGFSREPIRKHDLHTKHFLSAGTNILQSSRSHVMTAEVKKWEGSDDMIEGSAIAMCVAIGGQSTRGNLIRTVMFPNPTKFQFGSELNRLYFRVSMLLLLFFILECIFVSQGNWVNLVYSGLLFLGFALNPNLPVAIVWAQSIRAIWLSKKGITCIATPRLPIAAKLHVMVYDKTGTITKNGIDLLHVRPVTNNKFDDVVDTNTNSYSWSKALPPTLQHAMGCCHNVTTLADGTKIGNNVEVSMVETSGWQLPSSSSKAKICKPPINLNCGDVEILKVYEFDHIRMTSAVIIKDNTNTIKIIVKGSYERISQLSKSTPPDFNTVTRGYASDQYYVLAMGTKTLSEADDYINMSRESAEEGLDFAGLLLFRNEIKEDSAGAIEELRLANIRTVICTGDNALTALSVGRKCGMLPYSSNDINNVDESENAPLVNSGSWRTWSFRSQRSRTVDNIDQGVQVIFGDVDTSHQVCFTNESEQIIAIQDVVNSDPTVTEIVLTAPAFRLLCKMDASELEEHPSVEHQNSMNITDSNKSSAPVITKLMPMVRIFSRMKPEDKVQVIRLLQARGWVVGMAGDGGNDCGALRTAHIGVALTDAEASLVSPFSTTRESLFTVGEIIKSGRSCLTTNIATTCWFVVYGLCYSISKLYFDTAVDLACPGEWQYFFTAIVVCMGFANTMVFSKPLKTLSPVRPTFKLFGLRSVLSVSIAMLFYFIMLAVGEIYLKTRNWYKTCNLVDIGLSPNKWMLRSNNYDSAFWVLLQLSHLVFVGFMYSFGFKHRRSVFTNWSLLIIGAGILTWVFCLAWMRPNQFTCLFAINCDTETSMKSDLPFFKQLSIGSLGDCFLGPQLCDAHKDLSKSNSWQFPSNTGSDSNQCVFDKSGSDAASFQKHLIDDDYFCIGPNNCWPFSMKLAFTLIVTIGCGLMMACYWGLMKYTPGKKRHFGRY